LLQHAGEAAIPVVKKGQKVVKGDVVAEPAANKLGASIHASIDGTIAAIDQDITIEQ
jgi:Na+-translocating ferredoxin:NAD+ oxidoreductase RnfC subunit